MGGDRAGGRLQTREIGQWVGLLAAPGSGPMISIGNLLVSPNARSTTAALARGALVTTAQLMPSAWS